MIKKYTSLLWTNNKKSQNAPDFKGEIEIDGNKLQAAAWIKIAKNNSKYLSLSIDENTNLKKKILPKPIEKKRQSILINNETKTDKFEKSQTNLNSLKGSGGTKKNPPSYARYINEPIGSRADFIKDRKRYGK